MHDLMLNSNHDLSLNEFDLILTTNSNVIKQRITQALLTFKGEWFLNISYGISYYENILNQKNSLTTIRAIFIDAIKNIEGVQKIIEFNINLNKKTNSLEVNFIVIDQFNNNLNIEI